MLRVIFDTNIYGLLLKEKNADQIIENIKKDKEFLVYGYKPIRKEIQDIPKKTKLSKRTRVHLLSLYDDITGKHILKHSLKITNLAKKYYNSYRNNGGIYGWDTNIRIDFMVVACATFLGLDMVYSNDSKTMFGKCAIKSYHHINLKDNFRTPNFLKYKDLMYKFNN